MNNLLARLVLAALLAALLARRSGLAFILLLG